MKKEHFGSVVAVFVAFVVCRLLSYRIADFFGSVTGHHRVGGLALGSLLGALPFAVLAVFAVLQWRHVDVDDHPWLKTVAIVGWLLAGVVLGILPYSRFGLDTGLAARERAGAPGFLHALDVTIVVGLVLCVAGLLVAMAQGGVRRPGGAPGSDPAADPADRYKPTY